MCHYCGCRDIPLIKEFIAEHEAVYNLSGQIERALEHGDIASAQRDLVAIERQLRAHWAGEEQGLFAVMRDDPDCTSYIDALEAEHREMTLALTTADLTAPEGRDQVRASLATLWPHIAKEEDGLFPMSLTTLSGEQWDTAIDAWERVHGRQVPR
ncbi:hemerythrin domain-containing protein [Nocardia sp. XZ_19_385]|uniref:hemerythrin domain-containing protein n=1 Tax=Nocardia sp. XZ_19_385 TaxID=2769488 RepID=UPI0018901EC1|nr:hemerythrin domain-containing protein [Nocardia sp. XZ_19_385]